MSSQKIAIVSAMGLGDGLLSMVIANNLRRHHYDVTTFNNHLVQLKNWFPEQTIAAFPSSNNVDDVFYSFDKIISTDGAPLAKIPHHLGEKYHIFYERDFDRRKTVVMNFLDLCRHYFKLEDLTSDNAIVIPSDLQYRRYPKRIIIHPMSTCEKKNWLPHKFIRLAEKIHRLGFEPVFTVSPKERPDWLLLVGEKFPLPLFPTLDDLARYVYESGYMVGNDSGIGHLAANVGIPTLSLFARKSVANLWRPGWGKGKVVTASFQLPGARLRTRYWKQFLTVNKVFSEFKYLIKETR